MHTIQVSPSDAYRFFPFLTLLAIDPKYKHKSRLRLTPNSYDSIKCQSVMTAKLQPAGNLSLKKTK